MVVEVVGNALAIADHRQLPRLLTTFGQPECDRGMVGKVVPAGILAIRWHLPSGAEIDLGFRGNDRSEYDRWLTESTR